MYGAFKISLYFYPTNGPIEVLGIYVYRKERVFTVYALLSGYMYCLEDGFVCLQRISSSSSLSTTITSSSSLFLVWAWEIQKENKVDLIPIPFRDHKNRHTPCEDPQTAKSQPKPVL